MLFVLSLMVKAFLGVISAIFALTALEIVRDRRNRRYDLALLCLLGAAVLIIVAFITP